MSGAAHARRPGDGEGPKPLVVLVDDEPQVLRSLEVSLRRGYEVVSVTSAADCLARIDGGLQPAVVVTDLRMPVVDGVGLLDELRRRRPDVVRVMLTGQGDLEAAVRAVNTGAVFRFLTKPCPIPFLLAALRDAVAERERVVAEQTLLRQTLAGSTGALVDVLAMADPGSVERTARLRRRARALSGQLGGDDWQLEVALVLGQIGLLGLPAELRARLAAGAPLSAQDQEAVERAPAGAARVLAQIPRLEGVCAVLGDAGRRWFEGAGTDTASRTARAVTALIALDIFEQQGLSPQDAVSRLRERRGHYDAAVLDALAEAERQPRAD